MNQDSILANGFINETTEYCDRLIYRLREISTQIQSLNNDILVGTYVDISTITTLQEEARIVRKRIDENIATIGFYSNKMEFEDSDFNGIENRITKKATFISSSLNNLINSGSTFPMNSTIRNTVISFRNTGYGSWDRSKVALRTTLYNESMFISMTTDTSLPANTIVNMGDSISININAIVTPNVKCVVTVKNSIVSLIDGYVYGTYEQDGLDITN